MNRDNQFFDQELSEGVQYVNPQNLSNQSHDADTYGGWLQSDYGVSGPYDQDDAYHGAEQPNDYTAVPQQRDTAGYRDNRTRTDSVQQSEAMDIDSQLPKAGVSVNSSNDERARSRRGETGRPSSRADDDDVVMLQERKGG